MRTVIHHTRMRSYLVRLVLVLKVNLHIPPYYVFADSGGPVKSMQMRWLVQTLPWRPCAKNLLQN